MNDRTMIVTLKEDPETGDSYIEFPQDLLEQLGWREGDLIDWEIKDDGRIVATKAKIDGPVGP